jgi:hypothetical protein
MYLNETYSKVRMGKYLSGAFSIQNGVKQGDVLSSLLFNFALEYAIRKIQEYLEEMEVKGTYQFLFCAHGVNALGQNVNSIKHRNSTRYQYGLVSKSKSRVN